MGLFEGKTPSERNKMIVAAVLGVIALASLYFAFGPSFSGGSKTTVSVTGSPTPAPRTAAPTTTRADAALPSMQDQQFLYETTPVIYAGPVSAPEAGRNIFAFYEPPQPCDPRKSGDCPTPTPPPPRPVPPPSPVPTPPIILAYANPQSIYAGSRGFRLELGGDHIPPDARIFFNQTEMPTTYVSPQRAFADIPANMIAQESQKEVRMQTPDGKFYSNPVFLTVAAPPKPGYQYIGMKGGARYNNDTAYLIETGKTAPFGARLNDVVGGRFRLVDISRAEVVFEDTQLGFRHSVAMVAAVSGSGATGSSAPMNPTIQPFDPTTMKGIPGIPDNIPRYVPPQPQTQRGNPDKQKQDVDDAADDGKP